MQGNLVIDNVTKYYKSFKAVSNATLQVNQGEFFTILGPSGSGKTSLLKLIAGFEGINSGSITLRDVDIASKKPYERNIGMVFQNYALFPHMTVAENIAYPLKRRKFKKKEIQRKVEQVLEIVHLEIYGEHYPNQLSGGQQQRVALARAIVFKPPLLLLDEPLGALDKKLRQQMQFEIKNIQESLGITTISVTHDQEEALTMSDRICIMNAGGIEQIDTPENIYKYPRNRFVAEFIGEINLMEAELMQSDDEQTKVKTHDNQVFTIANRDAAINDNALFIALRPENIQLVTDQSNFVNTIFATVRSAVYLGEALLVKLETRTGEIMNAKIPSYSASSIVVGEERQFGWNASDATLLPKEDSSNAVKANQTSEDKVSVNSAP